jgi:hypothetical protein
VVRYVCVAESKNERMGAQVHGKTAKIRREGPDLLLNEKSFRSTAIRPENPGVGCEIGAGGGRVGVGEVK